MGACIWEYGWCTGKGLIQQKKYVYALYSDLKFIDVEVS